MTAKRQTKTQRAALAAAEGNRVTCAPSTHRALFERGTLGPVVKRFALKQQAPHGTWFNRQFVVADLVSGPKAVA